MEITFYRKNVYGKEMMYIAGEISRLAVMQLTKKSTIDEGDMTALNILGFTFTEVLAPKAN